jgi:hypothetical protein
MVNKRVCVSEERACHSATEPLEINWPLGHATLVFPANADGLFQRLALCCAIQSIIFLVIVGACIWIPFQACKHQIKVIHLNRTQGWAPEFV